MVAVPLLGSYMNKAPTPAYNALISKLHAVQCCRYD